MKITSLLNNNCIENNLIANSKYQAIEKLVSKLYKVHPELKSTGLSCDNLIDFVKKREDEQSTAVGYNVAFPHARVEGCKGLFIAIGVCKQGVDFKSPDKEPVNIICLLISEETEASLILQGMATLARFFNNKENRKSILNADTAKKAWGIIDAQNLQLSPVIYAHDIMHTNLEAISWDKTIYDAARQMHLKHMDVLPVVDENGNFEGDISCLELFSFGIPDFFTQLNTISFIKNIDPFEKYFKSDKTVAIKSIYRKNCGVVQADATLVEIVFQMTKWKHSKIYVVENGKFEGVIDRFNLVDRILCV